MFKHDYENEVLVIYDNQGPIMIFRGAEAKILVDALTGPAVAHLPPEVDASTLLASTAALLRAYGIMSASSMSRLNQFGAVLNLLVSLNPDNVLFTLTFLQTLAKAQEKQP